jgi:acyl-[acyl carrier protein]--UDP-N-acetylglucosamine O-acyltransferase
MHNPTSIYIDDDVIIEPDVEIGPHCVIQARRPLKPVS